MKSLDDIAAALQGYDPQALSVPHVLAFLDQLVSPLSSLDDHERPVPQALGYVLARDAISPVDVPPHDNSAMDGFAFDGTALVSDQALRLRVVGTALAGAAWRGSVGPDECVRIMTGAIMPAGLDTVAPQELVQVAEIGRAHV